VAVNRHIRHLFVIPEDDANRQMAIGFEKDDRVRGNAIQIVPPAGGWEKALKKLADDYFPLVQSNANSHVLVLIDCDGNSERLADALAQVPKEIEDRVFIVGTLGEPEILKKSLNLPLEMIGGIVADECFDPDSKIWQHDQLKHNAVEVARLKSALSNAVFIT
jgi:hypothetical protein